MRFLLDTNICIYVLNSASESLYRRVFLEHEPDELGVSAVTAAELRFGVEKSQAKAKNRARLELFLQELEVHPFGEEAAQAYGRVRAALERRGTLVGPLDMLIGSHGLSLGATLVTSNVREFRRIPGLPVENWMA